MKAFKHIEVETWPWSQLASCSLKFKSGLPLSWTTMLHSVYIYAHRCSHARVPTNAACDEICAWAHECLQNRGYLPSKVLRLIFMSWRCAVSTGFLQLLEEQVGIWNTRNEQSLNHSYLHAKNAFISHVRTQIFIPWGISWCGSKVMWGLFGM